MGSMISYVIDKVLLELPLAPRPKRPTFILRQNSSRLNRAAWRWLRRAGQETPAHYLHVLALAEYGLEEKVEGEWPDRDRPAVERQVGLLFGWNPDNALHWLVSNPNGASRSEQAHDLLVAVQGAHSPESAAAAVLGVIYSRQQAENPALQP